MDVNATTMIQDLGGRQCESDAEREDDGHDRLYDHRLRGAAVRARVRGGESSALAAEPPMRACNCATEARALLDVSPIRRREGPGAAGSGADGDACEAGVHAGGE